MGIDDSSSSSSAERSFRELDDVFLQSQARIWLGEVLHTRFDELLSICDLLSDGELLFEVSKALWNMLLVKYMELNNFKDHMVIPVDTRKSSGRYRPYSNVDSFLKVCKVLGLSGVDLFSPSDVVEKKDTRKVCMCIRSLSKKARSKQLNVPDFDDVTKTIAMPTDFVRCIRRSLELSTYSVTHGQNGQSRDARLKFSSSASHKQEDDSCLEESDEEISNFSDTSYADYLYLESPEAPETVDKYALTRTIQQVGTKKQEMDIFAHIPGSAESIVLQYVSSDYQLDGISSPVCESRLIICDDVTPINHEEYFWHDDGEPEIIDENALSMQNIGEVDHRISLSNSLSFRILTPVYISENCLCHSCVGSESHNSNTTPNTSICRIWRKFPIDIEPSSISGVSSVVGRVLDFDFDAKSETDDLRTSIPQFETKLENMDLSADSISPCGDDANLCRSVDQDLESLNHVSQTQPGILQEIDSKGFGNVEKEDDQLCTNQSDGVHYYAEDRTKAASKYERKEDGIDCLAEANTNGRNDNRTVNTEKKPTYIVPLMKTVAKGTALIGILFFLHLRNTSERNRNHKVSKKSSQIHWKSSGVGLSTRNGEKGSKIYPVEKFGFGD